MTYVIGEPCVDVMDRACVQECPVDCIYRGARMLDFHPEECVACVACEPVCPVEAAYCEDGFPAQWAQDASINAGFFTHTGKLGGAARDGAAGFDHPSVAALGSPADQPVLSPLPPKAPEQFMSALVERLERHQIAIYLSGIAVGVLVGLLLPGSEHLEVAINPVIALLLYATFLGVPFNALHRAFADLRFLTSVLVLNFVLVPVIVFALSRFVAGNQAVLIGVLLVLLCPCVDYVIVFARLAGGAADRLLAAAPLLMLAQMLLLPGYLYLMAGPQAAGAIDVGPFVHAFLVLIVLPLAAAAITQALAQRYRWARATASVALGAMVPLMFVTLAVVIASQVRAVSEQLGALAGLVPLYAVFAVVMVAVGLLLARGARLGIPAARAVIFSGVTRNSLVVLPLALALPASLALAPLVVVTQTLVELVVMVGLVRLLPALTRTRLERRDVVEARRR